MQPVVLFGSGGMLGTDLVSAWQHARRAEPDRYGELVPVADPSVVEITDPAAVDAFVGRHRPGLVINCAAYTDVEGCTRDPALAMKVNATAAGSIAAAAQRVGAHVLYISTDFVYDGRLNRPYIENDPVGPLSAYAESKLAGEREVRAHVPQACIVRTAWLYGIAGKSFVGTMLRLGETKDELRVVADQRGCPTYTVDLAEAILQLVRVGATGLVHAVNSGETTWHGLAATALRFAGRATRVVPITAAEYGSPTPRPAYSVLSTSRYTALTGRRLRPWDQALAEFVSLYQSKRR